jgi:excisionase family DNA binding protein
LSSHAPEQQAPPIAGAEPHLVSAPEVARRLGVGLRQLYNLLAAGELPQPTVLRGHRRYWASNVLAAYFASLTSAQE